MPNDGDFTPLLFAPTSPLLRSPFSLSLQAVHPLAHLECFPDLHLHGPFYMLFVVPEHPEENSTILFTTLYHN